MFINNGFGVNLAGCLALVSTMIRRYMQNDVMRDAQSVEQAHLSGG